MKKYKQLTIEQRYQIEALLQAGFNQTKIAAQLGVHRSTIFRELKRSIPKRGRGSGGYSASNAERKTCERHKQKHKLVLLTPSLKQAIFEQMTIEKWSPELISERWKLEGKAIVSHETIYKWIWQSKHTNRIDNKSFKTLYQELKHGKNLLLSKTKFFLKPLKQCFKMDHEVLRRFTVFYFILLYI